MHFRHKFRRVEFHGSCAGHEFLSSLKIRVSGKQNKGQVAGSRSDKVGKDLKSAFLSTIADNKAR